jgi:hypothetical protein
MIYRKIPIARAMGHQAVMAIIPETAMAAVPIIILNKRRCGT